MSFSVYAQCWDCGEWTFIELLEPSYGEALKGNSRCKHCDSHRLNPQSVISERTFDPIRAKRRKNNIVKRR